MTTVAQAPVTRLHAGASWRAWVRLPDEAGAEIDRMAARLGVRAGVIIRMIVLDYLERTEGGEDGLLRAKMGRTGEPPRKRERGLVWNAWVRLPESAWVTLGRIEQRRGVLPGVMIRMIVLDYLEQETKAKQIAV